MPAGAVEYSALRSQERVALALCRHADRALQSIHGSRAPDRIPGSAIFASGVEDPRLALRLGRTARALHKEAREWSGKSCSRSEAEWQAEKVRASAPVARETP